MLRIPKYGIVGLDYRQFSGCGASAEPSDPACNLLCLRHAVRRGIISGAFVFVVLILFTF
jgi:hypothetical protein